MAKGNLLTLVKSEIPISIYEMLDMSRQAAAGMAYLEDQKIVHRDLALRKIFLSQTSRWSVPVTLYGPLVKICF